MQHARFFFQAEDGIRDAQESRGLGDVYKRQIIILLRRASVVGLLFCLICSKSTIFVESAPACDGIYEVHTYCCAHAMFMLGTVFFRGLGWFYMGNRLRET